jgi:signal peptidase II
VVSIFLIKLILKIVIKEKPSHSLILGGAMGNLIDRVFRGYVVDSFDFYWRDWHWPAFTWLILQLSSVPYFSFPAACWVKKGSSQKTESMVTPVFATPILTTSWLA